MTIFQKLTGILKRMGDWTWYPWLAALYPVVFLYTYNYTRVFADDVLVACAAVLVATGIVVGLSWLIVRDIHKAAAMSLPFITGFFVYGQIVDQASADPSSFLNNIPLLPILLVLAVLIAGAIAFLAPSAALKKARPTLNLITLVLVAYNLVILGIALGNDYAEAQARSAALGGNDQAPRIQNDEQHPDVYYIILDGYASNASLMAESGIDNSSFTSGLEDRGFYVAYDSTSNYPRTLPSLASSLNMRYLVPNEGPLGEEGLQYLREMIADNAVGQKFQSLGYSYIFMLSGYDTASTIADLNIDVIGNQRVDYPHGSPPSQDATRQSFWPLMLDSTMLRGMGLEESLQTNARARPDGPASANRVLRTFEVGPAIAKDPAATFAVIHFIIPHKPVRFTKTGEILRGEERRLANTSNRHDAFADQLVWLNGRVLEMIDEIEANSSVPPIIIIQGDHGSLLGDHLPINGVYFYRILNAYYFPGKDDISGLSQDISPVNSFPILFNTYFDGNYGLTETKHFSMPSQDTMLDITETDEMMP